VLSLACRAVSEPINSYICMKKLLCMHGFTVGLFEPLLCMHGFTVGLLELLLCMHGFTVGLLESVLCTAVSEVSRFTTLRFSVAVLCMTVACS
jgi:hypothetical protein